MRYYKWLICGAVVLALAAGGVRIASINKVFPSPENKVYREGETFHYKGLEAKAGEVEIYNREEIKVAYPGIDMEDEVLENGQTEEVTYIVANVEISNKTENTISMGKTGVAQWILEAGLYANGADYTSFLSLNPSYSRTFYAGDTKTIKIVFTIRNEYMTKRELEETPLKVVYSYYPSKNYIYYEGKS